MTTKTLKHAMPIVATALGRKFGVQVQVGGQQAATDGQTIWLPDLPADSRLRPVAWGLLAHEASHVRHTDMAVYQTAARHSPLRRTLLNLLEDIRIERAIRRDYPGTEATLAQVIDWMLAQGYLDPPHPNEHPAQILTAALLLILRHRVLGQQALTQPAQEAERVLRQTFPPALVHRLFGLMTEVRALGSTAEAVALAERIQRLLDEEAQASQPEATSASDAPEETEHCEDEDGSDTSAGEADPASANEQTDETDGPDAAHEGTDQPASEIGDGSAEPEATSELDGQAADALSDGQDPASDDLLQRVLAAGEGDLGADLFASVRQVLTTQSGDGDFGLPTLPVPEDPPCHPPFGEVLHRQVEATSRALIARLQGLVQSSQMDRPHAVCRGRTLVPTRLHRAGVGDARLFARRRPRIAPNTAFHVLVDLSGSMNNQTCSGQRAFRVALESALAVALALERIPGVSVAVSAFPGLGGEDARITRLVQHGQSIRQRAGAFQQGPRGGTPLAQALWYAATDLTLRPETRRVILVMTDGVPNDWAATVEILGLCEANGIEPVGIGIACDVSALFRVGTRVEEAGDLKQALFGLAERLLVA
ncbi:von Willebrand factor type A [Thiorhodococcus drewsii AZ1]|uniref:von Willebrand factor type A n=1 Tax=Thiorhodococcus drewsii AZ1 TaxID=765913 RepID=G2DYM3_9GAMM|nr:VWA domain-containing protein [Thiorhodococcus drewsii]EGV32650.1 von Willebrand factor type A [Thiorhodococcus drewsii AZ1]